MMVEQVDRQESLLVAMSDKYMREILASTMVGGKSVEAISREKSIPSSTCYRRVGELLALDLLRVEHTEITEYGKKFMTYRSTYENVRIDMSCNKLTIDVIATPKLRQHLTIQTKRTYEP